MEESAPSDRHPDFIISARVYIPEPVPEDTVLIEAAERTKTYDDGSLNLSFKPPSAVIDDRQAAFESAWQTLIDTFVELEVTRTLPPHRRAVVELRISLTPDEGQAGLVFTHELLSRWLDLGGDIAIDALC
jgi:hypothetical protein